MPMAALTLPLRWRTLRFAIPMRIAGALPECRVVRKQLNIAPRMAILGGGSAASSKPLRQCKCAGETAQ
jgi:hypothetical protein